MRCSCSFQTQLLASRQQIHRFAKASLLRRRLFGRIDPTDVCPSVRWRQLLEILPRTCVRFQSSLDVRRDHRRRWPWGIPASARRCPLQSRCSQQSARLEVRVAATIDGGPLAVSVSRRELPRVAVVIQASDNAVDPTEAERLLDGRVIADPIIGRTKALSVGPCSGSRRP